MPAKAGLRGVGMQAHDSATSLSIATRDGVNLVRMAGLGQAWSIPVVLWHAPGGFDTSAKPDNQPHNTLAVRLSGSLVQRVKTDRAPVEKLSPDGFSVHPARHDLRFVARSEIRFAHLYVTEDYLREICRELRMPVDEKAELLRDDRVMYRDDEMCGLIEAYLARAFDESDRPSRLEMDSRANLIALRLAQRHSILAGNPAVAPATGTLADWQLRRVCRYMDENLRKEIGLADLAGLVGVSNEHFCRAFRRSTGLPPHRWLLRRRIAKAQALLADHDLTLTQVAQEVGYAGQSAFGVAFRKVTGKTPTQYRRDI
jgi:AraC family transcriptional regulator